MAIISIIHRESLPSGHAVPNITDKSLELSWFPFLAITLYMFNHLCIGVSFSRPLTKRIFSAVMSFTFGSSIEDPASFKCDAIVFDR